MESRRCDNPISLVQNLSLSIQLSDLEAGDLILYKPSEATPAQQQGIMFAQSLFIYHEHGHCDTTHTAFCVGQSEQGPLIAHIGPEKYVVQSLAEYDSQNRPFLVYRAYNQAFRQELARIASDKERFKDLFWSGKAATKAFFKKSLLDPKRKISREPKPFPTATFCSQFVIACLKEAALNINRDKDEIPPEYPHLNSHSVPKSLEAYLNRDVKNYQVFAYLGTNPYETFKKEIEAQIAIGSERFAGRMAAEVYENITARLENSAYPINDLQKIMTLIKTMNPLLEHLNPKASKQVYALARSQGIFKSAITNFSDEKLKKCLTKDEAMKNNNIAHHSVKF